MAKTPTGPTKSGLGNWKQYQGTEIVNAYTAVGATGPLRDAVNRFPTQPPGSDGYLGVHYAAQLVFLPTGDSVLMPAFDFVGYSKTQLEYIDKGYKAIVDSIKDFTLPASYANMLG